jgi:hypothetical protein
MSVCRSTVSARHSFTSPLGFWNWMTTSSLKMLTSSMPGIVFTPILFKVLWRRLSSVVVVLWTAFFFLPTVSSLILVYRSRWNFINSSYYNIKCNVIMRIEIYQRMSVKNFKRYNVMLLASRKMSYIRKLKGTRCLLQEGTQVDG